MKKKKTRTIFIFFLTLGIVLLVGLSFLLVWRQRQFSSPERAAQETTDGQNGEAGEKQEGQEEGLSTDGGLLWEQIPAEEIDDKEAKASEQEAEPTAVPTKYGEQLADQAYLEANRIYPWEAAGEESVTLGFVGDVLLDDEYAIMARLLQRGGSIEEGLSPEVLEYMRNVDIMTINNEFAFTDGGVRQEEKMYTFRADTKAASYLHDMGADVAVLANNHTYDFGESGFLDTLDTLDRVGVKRVGAGRNLEEAAAPIYFIANDIKIGVVAATQIERYGNPETKGATENSPGVFRCLDAEKLYESVRLAKENSDFVVVYIHWGTEKVTELDWLQLDQAPKLAEAGADLVIGAHPHCLQGIAYYGDTPVLYSLGNFWFNSRTLDTGMVQVEIDRNGIRNLQFIPAIQTDCRVKLALGSDKERILSDLRALSPGVSIDEEGFISRQ